MAKKEFHPPDGIGGVLASKRALEVGAILKKYGDISMRKIVEVVEDDPESYPYLALIIKRVTKDGAVENEKVKRVGQAIRAIHYRLPNDPVPGRTFRVFESVQLKIVSTWAVKTSVECAKDEFYRHQIFTRHEVRRKSGEMGVKFYKDYVKLVAKF